MPESVQRLKEKYEGEWLAIEVTKEINGEPLEGELVARSRDRDQIWDKAPVSKEKPIYIVFAGPPLKEGYAAAFK